MGQTKIAVTICLISSAAVAQVNQHLLGSDTLKRYTENLLNALGLEGPAHYDGGGSTLGIRQLIAVRMGSGQTVAPSTRFVTGMEVSQAAANSLRFVDHTFGLDGVVIHVNDAGNPALTRMKFSTAQQIWQCIWTNWTQVPESNRTDSITVLGLDEFFGITDNFVSRITGFNQVPADSWWNNYSCVTVCRPGPTDHCTELIGTITAADPTSIGYTGLPGLMTGNRDLALCNDTNPPGSCGDPDYVFQSATTIRNGTYPLFLQLHLYSVESTNGDGLAPGFPQDAWLAGALNPTVSCPLLQQQGFISDGVVCNY